MSTCREVNTSGNSTVKSLHQPRLPEFLEVSMCKSDPSGEYLVVEEPNDQKTTNMMYSHPLRVYRLRKGCRELEYAGVCSEGMAINNLLT